MDDVRPDSGHTLRLLDEATAGSEQALGQLLERHIQRVETTVNCRIDRRLRARIDAADVVQETQLEVTRRFNEFLSARPMPFHLWLRRATHQQLLKAERRHLQTAKRAVDREVPLPDRTSLHLVAGLAANTHSPVSQSARREIARRVRKVLAQLSETDREIIMLRKFEGLSNGEAACLLEISREAAKKRYTRALLRLQQLLRDEGLTGAQL
jgi:RNA polymerase sigma-70 factor (ECF subfamily)